MYFICKADRVGATSLILYLPSWVWSILNLLKLLEHMGVVITKAVEAVI